MLFSTAIPLLPQSLEIVDRCTGNRGWCTALRAFLFDRYAYYREADSLFSAALDALPQETACRWREIGALLDEQARSTYSQLNCAERRAMEERVWRLSDPLYMIAGNERRTAHYSRHVLDSLYAGGPSPFDHPDYTMPWSAAFSDILIRYGLPDRWANVTDRQRWPGDVVSWGLTSIPNYSFVPQLVPNDDSIALDHDSFRLRAPVDSVRERYRPDYDFIADLSAYQVAAFPRGDSMMVVAGLDLSAEPVYEAAPLTASIFLIPDHTTEPQVHVERNASRRVSWISHLARQNHLVSIEVLADSIRVAGRARFTVAPPARRMSDVLLFRPMDKLPETLDDALPLMHMSASVLQDDPLGLFWEVHGMSIGTTIRFELNVSPLGERRVGIVGWVRSVLGSSGMGAPRTIVWEEKDLAADRAQGRALTIDLRTLPPGEYQLAMTAQFNDGEVVKTARRIEIVRRLEAPLRMDVALNQPIINSKEGFTYGEPLIPDNIRVRATDRTKSQEMRESMLNPFRPWCPVPYHSSRWCERVIDGIGH